MSRPWDYPRWRRVLMQGVMWVILGGTLGLAQIVTHYRNKAVIVLGPPVRLGSVWVSLPEGWSQSMASDPETGVIQAIDPDQSRELTVSIARPVQVQTTEPSPEPSGESQGSKPVPAQPLDFAGLHVKGILVFGRVFGPGPAGSTMSQEFLAGVTILPTRSAIKITLRQGGPRISDADRMLVKAVANGITMATPPATTRPRSVPVKPPSAQPKSSGNEE